ncbi:hypothetical protein ACP3V5_08880 [Vibrio maritimus]
MKALIVLVALLGSYTTWLYIDNISKDAEIAKKSAEIDALNIKSGLKDQTISALEATLVSVRFELAEIQALSTQSAERIAFLDEQIRVQGNVLSITKSDKGTYLNALQSILSVNEEHKACMTQNLLHGTIGIDGSRTVTAGQSTCFSKYKESVTQIALQYGDDQNA